MKSIARLKEQARLHEQKEEWDKAIQAYEQALRLSEEGEGEPDLQLFNRIGDLHLRRGRQLDAVRSYERAADRYAEAGFYNNAIALCNKALRYAPDRAELYLKLGRYSGLQGFLTDARRYFLEFAERKQKAGAWLEALNALNELADLADDAELREMLAQRLEAHGEIGMAVQQLRRAYELRLAAGETGAAEAIAGRLRQLDPGAELPSAPSPADTPAREDGPGRGVAAHDPLPGLEIETAAMSAGLEDATIAVDPYPEPSSSEDSDHEGTLELPTLDYVDEADETTDETREADEAHEADEADDGAAGSFTGLAVFDEDAVDLLPELDDGGDVLPGAMAGTDADFGGVEELSGLESIVADDPIIPIEALEDTGETEVEAALDRARSAAEAGDAPRVLEEIDGIRDRLDDPSVLERALDVAEALVDRASNHLGAHQLRVELATRSGQRSRLVAALEALADCLNRKGAKAKAEAVYERILELDPENRRARTALRRDPAPVEYVDLGNFITDEMLTERAGGGKPSEDADFDELLSRFRAKTAAPVADDPSSHYDLGLAFKEMGLIDEAIVEFQRALDGGAEQLKIYEELGQCFMHKGEYALAAKILERALKVPRSDERELIGVYYHLGCCHEALGSRAEARAAFERVVELGGIFRDVAERLARL